MALSAKNKLGFIDKTIPRPDPTKYLDEFALWKRCNDIFLSWILNSVDADLGTSVINTYSTFDVWVDLKERFSRRNVFRLYQIHQTISSLLQD